MFTKNKLHQSLSGRTNLPLLSQIAIWLAVFAYGVSEGSLTVEMAEVSRSLQVNYSYVGVIISISALINVLIGPFLSIWLGKYSLRFRILIFMGIFLIGSIIMAWSNSYLQLFIGKIVCTLAYAGILVTAIIIAMHYALPNKKAVSVGEVLISASVSVLVGLPAVNYLAKYYFWQLPFLGLTFLALIILVLLWYSLPGDSVVDYFSWKEVKVFKKLTNIALMVLCILIAMAAGFSAIYLQPILLDILHLSANKVPIILLVIGIGYIAGNYLGAKFTDINLKLTLFTTFGGMIITIILLTLTGTLPEIPLTTIFFLILLGAFFYAAFTPLDVWATVFTKNVPPSLALTLNNSAYNIGFAAAGLIGAIHLDLGFDLRVLPAYGIVPLLAGIWILFRLKAPKHVLE